jgi:DivIVA domain-containing protein
VSSSQTPGERFRHRRFSRGYKIEDVDALLAQAELGAVTASDVRETTFSTVYGGYDERQVDDELDALAERLNDGRP